MVLKASPSYFITDTRATPINLFHATGFILYALNKIRKLPCISESRIEIDKFLFSHFFMVPQKVL